MKRIVALLMALLALAPVAALAQGEVGADVPPTGSLLSDIFTSNSEILFTLLAAAAIPWVVALIVQQTWGTIYKQIAAFIVCAVAAAGYLIYKDDVAVLSWEGLPRLFVLVASVAYFFYRMYWKPVTEVADKTSIRKSA